MEMVHHYWDSMQENTACVCVYEKNNIYDPSELWYSTFLQDRDTLDIIFFFMQFSQVSLLVQAFLFFIFFPSTGADISKDFGFEIIGNFFPVVGFPSQTFMCSLVYFQIAFLPPHEGLI